MSRVAYAGFEFVHKSAARWARLMDELGVSWTYAADARRFDLHTRGCSLTHVAGRGWTRWVNDLIDWPTGIVGRVGCAEVLWRAGTNEARTTPVHEALGVCLDAYQQAAKVAAKAFTPPRHRRWRDLWR